MTSLEDSAAVYDVPPLLVSTAASPLVLSPAVERAKLNEIRK